MSNDAKVYVISVATNLVGMYVQALRNCDRLELVIPQRTSDGGCHYTKHDAVLLRKIQHLSQEDGVNLAGIKAATDPTERVGSLKQENIEL